MAPINNFLPLFGSIYSKIQPPRLDSNDQVEQFENAVWLDAVSINEEPQDIPEDGFEILTPDPIPQCRNKKEVLNTIHLAINDSSFHYILRTHLIDRKDYTAQYSVSANESSAIVLYRNINAGMRIYFDNGKTRFKDAPHQYCMVRLEGKLT